jgi:sialic acid synthase SpsE
VIPAIYCDIDGVTTKKFALPNYDKFGQPNENMLRVLTTLARDYKIVFITGRWAIGQAKVQEYIKSILPGVDALVFCKPQDYPTTTANFKLDKIKELEESGYRFDIGFDDHTAVIGLLHNHGMFVAEVVSD